jgi:hypothetical protein
MIESLTSKSLLLVVDSGPGVTKGTEMNDEEESIPSRFLCRRDVRSTMHWAFLLLSPEHWT